jgi:hypothetical protein
MTERTYSAPNKTGRELRPADLREPQDYRGPDGVRRALEDHAQYLQEERPVIASNYL